MNQFALSIVGGDLSLTSGAVGTFQIGKKYTEGSFARAIAFASKDARHEMGKALYAKWLSNGQYRPLVTDILNCGLIAKSAVPVVQEMAGLRDAGGVSKETLVRLCRAVQRSVDNAERDGKKAPTGQKAFVYSVVQLIANHAGDPTDAETIDVTAKLVPESAE